MLICKEILKKKAPSLTKHQSSIQSEEELTGFTQKAVKEDSKTHTIIPHDLQVYAVQK